MKILPYFFSVLMLFGCKDKGSYSTVKETTASSQIAAHKIVVKETIDGGDYTYINAEENGNTYWMAISNAKVTVGDVYYYDGGLLMKDFESKQLNRTFDEITFIEGIRTTEKAVESDQENTHINADVSTENMVKIEKPKNGTSLSELFSAKKSFSGKSIIVKGQVVKVNNGIMNKNWVHIVDGTQFDGKNDLGITTLDSVNIGDIVTFKGKLSLDKDFGHGYVYPILLEDAKLVK